MLRQPLTPDEIALVMLEEMIVSDPQWIQECAPAGPRCGNWRRRHHEPWRSSLTALKKAGFNPELFWETLGQNLPPG